ncbi:type VI secretion system baseplate subunit TssF [Chitinimonas viridis]|uniref:Type VI secretion system baseplate subunit TssF n=2 Tax=Chitinimonas TaxID=240411 RepID=A0ABT8BBN9_9NEIS|nr:MULTISPECIES: type VI secretion system baseplate subunit TssF [Chitinimonas]MDN3579205.1 type VI secretion system baseplate subunit TssF [Chitinimonas viridis]GLR15300.1 type VI secretion system protein ImpG [Chitinimonas prasina]
MIDPRFLELYNQELRHVREMGGEFAQAFPKIAGRLGMGGVAVEDPYVERLLEGFAFLAARVQLKQEAAYPAFTSHLLDMVYPHYGMPVPAMAIARFRPSSTTGSMTQGYEVPRGARLRGRMPAGEQTACEFSTAQAIKLWPIDIVSARYQTHVADLPIASRLPTGLPKGLLRIKLKARNGLGFDKLNIDDLPIYLSAADDVASRLAELILGAAQAVAIYDPARPAGGTVLPTSVIAPVGFEPDEALLPYQNRSFDGYRLLHEYFAFPQRYLFFRLKGLEQAIRTVKGDTLEIVIPLSRGDDALASLVDEQCFALFCTPVINLFTKRLDRVHVDPLQSEYHAVVDRRRPQDFEIMRVEALEGYGPDQQEETRFLPFYATYDQHRPHARAFFTSRREPRLLSLEQRRTGGRASYLGSELFVRLVDGDRAPFSERIVQLGGEVLASNRDLPLLMPIGGDSDFTLLDSAPVDAIQCLRGPSRPIPAVVGGEVAWRLVNHLSLNHLVMTDLDGEAAARALRDMLLLYAERGDVAHHRHVESVERMSAAAVTRRLPGPGPLVFGRGVEIKLTINETVFGGASPFVLGMVLERFLARQATLNSFTEMVLVSTSRGELKRWPARAGVKALL